MYSRKKSSSLFPLPSALYQWDELMCYADAEHSQGLCPPGWHVPSESNWNMLFANWTNNAFAGAPLKYSGYSGFNALLAGAEFFNRSWNFDGFATFFWSSTSHGPWKAWAHGMNDYDYSVSYYPSYRSNAFSVRCVRD
ncbi:MAG: FISUMP domain-containing protein [bacterium]